MTNTSTDIIVVFYGEQNEPKACVDSVERHCGNYKLHIIDNNVTNRAFTRGVNEGIDKGRAPYVWLLNQDAIVLPGAQEALIERLNSAPQVGIAGSMQFSPGDNNFITHGGTLRAFPGGVHKGGRLSKGECLVPEKQTWVNFDSVMLKREMIRRIGHLDKGMFLFYSDSDYCYWARCNGWEVWYEPASRVIHEPKAPKTISEWHIRDRDAFAEKWGLELKPDASFTCNRFFYDLNASPITIHPPNAFYLSVDNHPRGGKDIKDQGMIEKSCREYPGSPEYYCSFGNTLTDQKRFGEAIFMYQKALKLQPDLAVVHYNLGNVLKKQGRTDEAMKSYLKAVDLEPNAAEPYYNMGNTFKDQGKLNEAVSCYKKATDLRPDYAEARCNLGLALQEKGALGEAVRHYEKTTQIMPDLAEAWYGMGNALKEKGELEEAIFCFQKALVLRPDNSGAYNNMGNIFREQRRLEKAIFCYEKAVQIEPGNAATYNNMGSAFQDRGEIDMAIAKFDEALKLRPEHAETHFNRALALLVRGDLVEGWKGYEWRFKKPDWKTAYPEHYKVPRWDGSCFAGKRLLVHHEQGHGDNLQFIRYLPMVKARGGSVIFETSRSLFRLFRNFPEIDELVERTPANSSSGEFDIYIPLLSLPGIFGTTLETIPGEIPYLHADPREVELWETRLRNGAFKVGIVWAGNPDHKNDRNRSCALDHFLPLADIPGVKLYGLQKEMKAGDRTLNRGILADNLGEYLDDFATTAGVLENLDLLISVDTSVAHLAGAMGRPVWLLLPFAPDWRWLLNREDSPWYPTMRLFRQERPGDWDSVIRRMAKEVSTVMAGGIHGGGNQKEKDYVLRKTEGFDTKQEFRRACQYHQSGDLKRAETICREILTVYPDDPNVLNLLGLIAHQLGENDMAANLMSRAIRNDPESPFLYNNLGAVFHDSGKFPEAITSYKKAIHIKPDYADPYNNMGLVFQEQGKADEAISCYQEALQLQTNFPEANYNLGNALKESGKLAEAIEFYQRATQLRPDYPEACNNMGNAFNDQGKLNEAVACLNRAVTLRPDFPEAYYNLGNALHGRLRLEEALISYEKALELRPNYPEAHNNIGIVFKDCGRLGKAIECYKTALGLKPDFSKAHSDLLLAMNYDPSIDLEGIFLESLDWWRRHGEPHAYKFHHKARNPHRRLRIGYVSPDFRGHSVSYFFLPLLMAHDRNEVEVFCYAEVKRPDEMTVRIRDLSDHWRSTVGLGDDAIAQKIYEDGIDILVDLAGHTANNRLPLFARKPAPVQVTWLGYPGTTGTPVMDYRFTDEIADPEGDGDEYYSETLVRLKDGFLCYLPPDGAPDIAGLPALESESITFGSFNNLPKLNEKVIKVWSEILLQVPGSSLLLKSRQLADESTSRRYMDLFIKNGVTPDRIRTLPATSSILEHLELYNRVDIALDPFPYNGTTTTCEALWMGVPVVTLRGNRHSSRVGTSILTRVGLKELVAETENDYVSKGAGLACDLGRLQALRKGMCRRMKESYLCDAGSFARSVEKVYRKLMIGNHFT